MVCSWSGYCMLLLKVLILLLCCGISLVPNQSGVLGSFPLAVEVPSGCTSVHLMILCCWVHTLMIICSLLPALTWLISLLHIFGKSFSCKKSIACESVGMYYRCTSFATRLLQRFICHKPCSLIVCSSLRLN